MLRYLTAGESHGQALAAIMEGIPSGLRLHPDFIGGRLAARQSGYGRGGRMKIEKDSPSFLSGVRDGVTLGSPLSMLIPNKDWENWRQVMAPFEVDDTAARDKAVSRPRPGHADLAGALKYQQSDIRNILERASARETAIRTAVGAVAEQFLLEFEIELAGHVIQIGNIFANSANLTQRQLLKNSERSPVRCADSVSSENMMREIDKAAAAGDTLGGKVEVVAYNVPLGLGSHVQHDRRLDARLAAAVMSVPAIKAVEIGEGVRLAGLRGSEAHDEIFYKTGRKNRSGGFYRKTNRAGGIEGGISNGEDIIVRATMKPIPTLGRPLRSADIHTRKPFKAAVERSDICAVPAASVIARAAVAIELASAMLEKFGGDSMGEIKRNFDAYLESLREFQ
jgi:chorismate synthase